MGKGFRALAVPVGSWQLASSLTATRGLEMGALSAPGAGRVRAGCWEQAAPLHCGADLFTRDQLYQYPVLFVPKQYFPKPASFGRGIGPGRIQLVSCADSNPK